MMRDERQNHTQQPMGKGKIPFQPIEFMVTYQRRPKIEVYDTTLREGFQTPGGIGASQQERLYAAHLIAQYADWVELGMPANPNDREIIGSIRDYYRSCQMDTGIGVLCRLLDSDIDAAADVIGRYHKSVVHLFIGTSDEHRKAMGKDMSPADYAQLIEDKVAYAACNSAFSHVMFSPEDGMRGYLQNPELGQMFVDAAIRGYEKSARTAPLILNFPDTSGCATSTEFMYHLSHAIKGKKATGSVHTHNDSGMANAHTIEGVLTGLTPFMQTTFFSSGERNGIGSTELAIAMLYNRGLLEGKSYATADNMRRLVPVTRAIAAAMGRPIPAESLVAGFNTNTSTSGIHTQKAGNDPNAYHIYGETFGAKPILEFGPTSGANQVVVTLAKVGIEKTKTDVAEFTNKLKYEANAQKRALSETELQYRGIHEFSDVKNPLEHVQFFAPVFPSGNQALAMYAKYQGKRHFRFASSSGPVTAMLDCMKAVVGNGISIRHFQPYVVPSLPEEYLTWDDEPKLPVKLNESELQVSCAIESGDELFWGYAKDQNSMRVQVNAPLDAIIKMETIRAWKAKQGVSP